MIILGIDPALTKSGWGIIETKGSSIKYIASGTILTKSDQKLEDRLSYIYSEIKKIIELHKPEAASMEEIFVNVNAVSPIKLCHARGAIIAAVGRYKIPLREFAPDKIKKTISGAGKADKSQIIYMINMMMEGANISQEDEADALAAAYTCWAYK